MTDPEAPASTTERDLRARLAQAEGALRDALPWLLHAHREECHVGKASIACVCEVAEFRRKHAAVIVALASTKETP